MISNNTRICLTNILDFGFCNCSFRGRVVGNYLRSHFCSHPSEASSLCFRHHRQAVCWCLKCHHHQFRDTCHHSTWITTELLGSRHNGHLRNLHITGTKSTEAESQAGTQSRYDSHLATTTPQGAAQLPDA